MLTVTPWGVLKVKLLTSFLSRDLTEALLALFMFAIRYLADHEVWQTTTSGYGGGERTEMHRCMAGDSHVVIKRLLEEDRNRLEALQKSDWHCNQKKGWKLIWNIHIHGIVREISAYRDRHCEVPTE